MYNYLFVYWCYCPVTLNRTHYLKKQIKARSIVDAVSKFEKIAFWERIEYIKNVEYRSYYQISRSKIGGYNFTPYLKPFKHEKV